MTTPSQILEEIKRANSILTTCHSSMDADSVGSVLALYHALKQIKKEIKIIFADNQPDSLYDFLPAYDHIKKESWGEQDLSQFDLLIALDSSSPGQVSKELTRQSETFFTNHLKTIVIDHHASNQGYGYLNLIDSTAAATCQILYRLFISWKIDLTPHIAICLFTGLYSDSKFKYSSTTAETYQTAADLLSTGINFYQAIDKIDNSLTPKSLKFIELVLENKQHYFQNQVIISAIPNSQIEKHHIAPQDKTKGDSPNLLRSIIGNDIVAIVSEIEPGVCDCTFRTRDPQKYNVSLLATALGGGGHPTAAGCQIEADTVGATNLILEAIAKTYPNLSP